MEDVDLGCAEEEIGGGILDYGGRIRAWRMGCWLDRLEGCG
jgi:hypothetical protein